MPRQVRLGAAMRPYTVLLQCCDPVVPIYMRHFGALAQSEAAELFAKLRDEEIAEGAPGGSEFSIEFWHHTTLPAEPKFMADDDGTIYNVTYPSSTLLDKFDYMDLMRMEGEIVDGQNTGE